MDKKPVFLCESMIMDITEKDKVLVRSFHTWRKM